jgi:hypothetical protein
MLDEDDPSLLEHAHRTSIRVNMATTKVFGGVPIYNYHLANAGGMNPSLAELTEQKTWIIMMDAGTTDDDEKKFCADLAKLGTNVQCIDSGDPDNNGEPYVTIKANEAELRSVLKKHYPHVKYGEPDGPVSIDDPEPEPSLIEEAASLPWGLDRLDDTTGQDGSYNPPANSKQGDGAHVYVADTGVRISHQDFEGRATAAFDWFKSGSNKECGASDTNCAGDTNGHGTHCAGTIGGKQYGVAKKTKLYSLKVLNPSGSFTGIIGSLDYVMSKGNKPAVWSASLGGKGKVHSVADTFVKAKAANILISVAAGNDNDDACNYSPAFAPAAVTVGATQIGDTRASFSNYGSCVDIFAPGKSVLSAWWNSDTASKSISGTSMACPHVSGVAALIYGDFPGVDAATVEQNMKAYAGKDLVKDPKSGTPNLMLHVPSWVPDSPLTTMPPPPTTAPPPLPACKGDPKTWKSAWGDCSTYKKGGSNHGFCASDSANGFKAVEVCPGCGKCSASGSPPATTMPPPATTMPPPATTMPPPATTMPPPATTMPPPATTMPEPEPEPTTMPPPATTMPPPTNPPSLEDKVEELGKSLDEILKILKSLQAPN